MQMVKDEIDEIRDSLDKLEAESQRRKNKLLEQVTFCFISINSKHCPIFSNVCYEIS